MSNALYWSGRNGFARGEIAWKAAGGDAIRCFLVSGDYAPDLAADEFLSDIPAGYRCGNGGGTGREDGVLLTLKDPTNGICDADDATMTAPPAGGPYPYLVIYKDDGVAEESSVLLVLIDTAAGLPITTTGGDVSLKWDNGANKIFKL